MHHNKFIKLNRYLGIYFLPSMIKLINFIFTWNYHTIKNCNVSWLTNGSDRQWWSVMHSNDATPKSLKKYPPVQDFFGSLIIIPLLYLITRSCISMTIFITYNYMSISNIYFMFKDTTYLLCRTFVVFYILSDVSVTMTIILLHIITIISNICFILRLLHIIIFCIVGLL